VHGRLVAILLTALLGLVVAAPAAPAAAKKGKIKVCVQKSGKDRGAMRFSGKKGCKKDERKLTWNKKGQRGPAGERGPEGSAGEGASPDQLAALQQALAATTSRITELETQLATACGQLTALTTQSNLLGTALDGIGLGGTIPPLLTLITPSPPPALPAFSC